MKKILIVLFGVLIFQGYVFAETWEDCAANKAAWSAEFPNDPACWNPPVGRNTDNPWIVGKGDVETRPIPGSLTVLESVRKMILATMMVGGMTLRVQ